VSCVNRPVFSGAPGCADESEERPTRSGPQFRPAASLVDSPVFSGRSNSARARIATPPSNVITLARAIDAAVSAAAVSPVDSLVVSGAPCFSGKPPHELQVDIGQILLLTTMVVNSRCAMSSCATWLALTSRVDSLRVAHRASDMAYGRMPSAVPGKRVTSAGTRNRRSLSSLYGARLAPPGRRLTAIRRKVTAASARSMPGPASLPGSRAGCCGRSSWRRS
jgi:hypothetical protein